MLFYFLPQPSFTFFTGGNKSLPIPPPEKELQIHIHEFYRILMAFLFINVDLSSVLIIIYRPALIYSN